MGETTPPVTPTRSSRARPAVRPDDGRLVRGRASRKKIREAALSLFRERGFDAATLRAIGARAGMGASSIYRHIESKEELLVEDLAERQEEAWTRFRRVDDRHAPVRERLGRFLDAQHALLASEPDLTTIALRATTHPEARVAKRVLALQDRTIGLVAEVLQGGRMRGDLRRDLDVLAAARAIHHVTTAARIPWANGLVSADACQASILAAVELLFRGLEALPTGARAPAGAAVRAPSASAAPAPPPPGPPTR
jgi:AcrR family transcriptional regulator